MKHNISDLFIPFNLENYKTNIDQLYSCIVDSEKIGIVEKSNNAQFYTYYKYFKQSINLETYLTSAGLTITQMRIVAKARTDMLPLNYKPWIKDNNFKCSLCNFNVDENLFHFIAECKILTEFRMRYFGKLILPEN